MASLGASISSLDTCYEKSLFKEKKKKIRASLVFGWLRSKNVLVIKSIKPIDRSCKLQPMSVKQSNKGGRSQVVKKKHNRYFQI